MARYQFKYTLNYRITDGESGWLTEYFTNQRNLEKFISELVLENDCLIEFEIEKEQLESKKKTKK
jgi:hypothetical protein